jgi:transcriptional regulator with XRE-family HTH domain
MTDSAAESTMSATVRRRVRELRHRKGWTVLQLAQQCEELGLDRLTVDVITSLELGAERSARRRKSVTVDELVGLALALGVSPVHLMVDDEQEPWTVGKVDVPDPLFWFAGMRPEPVWDTQFWGETHPDRLMLAAFTMARQRIVAVLREAMDELVGPDRAARVYGPVESSSKGRRTAPAKKGARGGKRPTNP